MKIFTFTNFPKEAKCVICGTNEDKECVLIPIDGTADGNICEASPTHVDCIKNIAGFRYNKELELLYKRLEF